MSTTAMTMNNNIANPLTPDKIVEIKSKMKAAWSDGDYDTFSRFMSTGANIILDEWQIQPGARLLDVACGSGQTALPAAAIGARVTGIDIAANSIAAAKERANLEGLDIHFEEADAENIPFEDDSFDTIISMLGAMFAPRPERVVAEFSRVCRSGGTLRMVNWTAQGLVGQMFKIVGSYVAPPAGVVSAMLWGNEESVNERLSNDFTDIVLTRKYYPAWQYPFSATELVDFFRKYYGPVKRAFSALDHEAQKSLHSELQQNFEAHNMANDGTLNLKSEYLDVFAIRK